MGKNQQIVRVLFCIGLLFFSGQLPAAKKEIIKQQDLSRFSGEVRLDIGKRKTGTFRWKRDNKKLDISYKKTGKNRYQISLAGFPTTSRGEMDCAGSVCRLEWTTIYYPIFTAFFSVCGDGTLEGEEQCDDGNRSSNDGCSPSCHFEHICGNGVLENGEECDDGNQRSRDGCSYDCKIQVCGNGVIEPYETCDDGNMIPGDGCNSRCVIECILSSRAVSSYHCPSTCGNGVFERGEGCDDGNLTSRDGCSASCEPDTPITLPEPETVTCYACSAGGSCEAISASSEVCALFYDEPTCDEGCAPAPLCGNEIVEAGETCDDGNAIDSDLCTNACRLPDEIVEDCEDPEAAGLEPGTRLRVYPDSTHISRCETEDSVRYIICGNDGEITVGINECDVGTPCVDGACIVGDPIEEPTCTDSDGDNKHARGAIYGIEMDGDDYVSTDICGGDGTGVVEYICEGEERGSRWRDCDAGEICEYASVPDPVDGVGTRSIGACVPGTLEEWICTDTDGDDRNARGAVYGTEPDGDPYAYSDICAVDGTGVFEYVCEGGGWTSRWRECNAAEACETASVADPVDGVGTRSIGACVPGDLREWTCTDSDGDNKHARGVVYGTEPDGDPYAYEDICSVDSAGVVEYICEGENWTSRWQDCDAGEICRYGLVPDPVDGVGTRSIGACIRRCTCARTTATATEAGFVTDNNCVVQHDLCRTRVDGSLELVQYECGIDGLPRESETVLCPDGCEDGLCR